MSAAPSTTTEAGELPTETPADSAPDTSLPSEAPASSAAGDDLTTWVAQANSACQAAVSEIQQVRAENGSGNPEDLARALAQAVTDASDALDGMTAPTGEAETMTTQADQFAADEQTFAADVQSGSVSDETSDNNRVEEAGAALAATADDLGADQCAEMATEA